MAALWANFGAEPFVRGNLDAGRLSWLFGREVVAGEDPFDPLSYDALLVIDDIGYVRKDEAETSVLFELVMHRYERKSLLVTSNQPFSEWENVFSTSAMTVAAVDRLVDHSTIIQINGESYRRRRARRAGSAAAK